MILALVLVSGCGKDSPWRSSMRIGVNVTGVYATKASAVTGINKDGESFTLCAYLESTATDNETGGTVSQNYIEPETVSYNGSGWTMTGDYNWANGIATTFWAWYPATDANRSITNWKNTGTLTFSYTTDTDPTAQNDLLFAKNVASRTFNAGGTQTAQSGDLDGNRNVNIGFYHALSQICFALSPDDDTFNTDLQITSISITNLYTTGSCSFTGGKEGFAWTPSEPATSTVTASLSGVTSGSSGWSTAPTGWTGGTYKNESNEYKTIYTLQNTFFVIPQNPGTNGSMLSITFKKGSETDTIEVALPSDDWLAGRYYKYKIGAKKVLGNIEFTVSLIDWTDGGSADL